MRHIIAAAGSAAATGLIAQSVDAKSRTLVKEISPPLINGRLCSRRSPSF
jgi:hypothetical protein